MLLSIVAKAESIYIDNFSIEAGETKQVSIKMTNSQTWSAFQLEMYLPAGLTMAKDDRGRLRYSANPDRSDGHTFTFSDRDNGQYNAVYYSINSYGIIGNSGEIVSFYVTAAQDFSGTATINLKEVYVSDNAGNMTKIDDTSCTVTSSGTPHSDLATGIRVDLTSAKMMGGFMMSLYATVEPATAVQKVAWSSSNKAVATVDAKGRITAVAPGAATITATTTDGSNLSATSTVKVYRNGDLNYDYKIDVADLNANINIILGLE